jgi:hypothetical protein
MFGRFFAFEMGCPNEDATPGSKFIAYLNEDGSISQGPDQMQDQISDESSEVGPDGMPMVCECRGLGCKKCKRKKAQVITLTGATDVPLPVMNMPMGPGGPSMIMMGRPRFF